MIYTVTLNASIDYIGECDNFTNGKGITASSLPPSVPGVY